MKINGNGVVMKKILKNVNFGVILIIFGSIIGFIIENVRTCITKDQCILRQGLLYGPFIPVYGVGLLILYIIYSRKVFQNKKILINIIVSFVLGFFLGSIVEYLFSYAQEKIFGTISWNYSHLKYNLYGRISLSHSLYWGLLGVIFSILLLSPLMKLKTKFDSKRVQKVITVISCLFLVDIIISSVACLRATERRNGKPATSIVDKACDKFYPDEYINRIYTNARVK